MALIRRPDAFRIKRIQWDQDVPAQINRSGWTQRRQVVTQPGPPLWRASFELVPIIGEANMLKVRSFLAKLKGSLNSFYLPATENAQTSSFSFPHVQYDAPFVNNSGTTVTGRTIEKVSGGAGWNASAHTSTGYTSGARLSFRAGQIDQAAMMALNSDPLTDSDYISLDYAIYLQTDGLISIYESGGGYGTFGPYSPDDILSIVYDNATVRYYRGAELLRSVSTAAGRTFYGDSSFHHVGAKVLDVSFGGAATVVAGAAQITLLGFSPSTLNAVKEGWMATLLLYGGGAQLVTITADASSTSGGEALMTFQPPARATPFAVVTGRPFAEVAQAKNSNGWSVDPGQLYGVALEVEEAF